MQLIDPKGKILETEVNRNGFPCCPVCEEDELYSLYLGDTDGKKSNLEVFLRAGLSCYKCCSEFQWFENR